MCKKMYSIVVDKIKEFRRNRAACTRECMIVSIKRKKRENKVYKDLV